MPRDMDKRRAWARDYMKQRRALYGRTDKRTPQDAARQQAWREAHPEEVRQYLHEWQPRGDNVGFVPALAPEQVRDIRRKLVLGFPRRALAVEYGVAYNTIRRIDVGDTYTEREYQP